VFYKPECYKQYYGLLGDYSDVILGHFAGHFNNDVLTAVVDGPGLDQFDGPVKGGDKDDDKDDDHDNQKVDKRSNQSDDTDNGNNDDGSGDDTNQEDNSSNDDGSGDDTNQDDNSSNDDGSGDDTNQDDNSSKDKGNKKKKNRKYPTHGTGKAIVSRDIIQIQKRHKESPTTSQLHPPYGHVALIGKPISLPNRPKVLGILFNCPSIVPLNNPGIRVYEYATKGDS
jgi:hypothetical protein